MTLQPDPGDDVDEIRLTLPALAPYARVARLAITGLASRSGFSYDEVEDLRIAIGEIFGLLVDPAGSDARVQFRCRQGDDALEIDAERVPEAAIPEVPELSRQILAAVASDAIMDTAVGRISIVKRQEPRR